MSTKSRRKGKAGELELAGLGNVVSRNLAQCRRGGRDLIGIEGWAIECKRAAVLRLAEWWQQTLEQAQQAGCKPALAYRLDR